MDYRSDSFRAQRLEGIGRTAMFNRVLDDLAAQALTDFDGLYAFTQGGHPFSQTHAAGFALSGIKFTSAEQYVEYAKAMLFGDRPAASRILATNDPEAQRRLGGGVRDFDPGIWRENARRIVYEGNCGKFMQNRALRDALSATANALLVYAEPEDMRWGLGLAAGDERVAEKSRWPGENGLGYVLTLLREDMRAFAKSI